MLYNIRKKLFWTVDFLKGGKVAKYFKDVKFIEENSSSNKSKEKKEKYLKDILEHASKNVPYYSNITKLSLENFPVIDKILIRENFDEFQSKTHINKKNHTVTTSGSTGNPFKVLQDKNKKARNTADTIYYAEKTGFELGTKLYYFRLWDKQYKKSNLLSRIQNIGMYSVDDFYENDIANLISDLKKDKGPKSFLGYTSALHSICKYLDKTNTTVADIKLNSVIAVAESLSDYVKKSFIKYFNIIPVSRYSNSENGILAQQDSTTESNHFEINWASYYIEVLEMNSDKPVKLGEPGRIVITDLFNFSLPMIRYDSGDVGKIDFNPLDKKKPLVFTSIEGRKMDMFTNTKGELLSSHIVHKILQYNEIDQFQFVQEDKINYKIKLKPLTEKLNASIETKLIAEYTDYFGDDAKIKLEYVDDIPTLKSGKRKLVINKTMVK